MSFLPDFKSVLAFLFFLLLSSNAYSAKFKVESFKKDESDLAARRFERQDINGESCALVKISTDFNGLNFHSNFGTVFDLLKEIKNIFSFGFFRQLKNNSANK